MKPFWELWDDKPVAICHCNPRVSPYRLIEARQGSRLLSAQTSAQLPNLSLEYLIARTVLKYY